MCTHVYVLSPFRHVISRNKMLENEQERLYKGMIKGLMKVASGERLRSGFGGLIM